MRAALDFLIRLVLRPCALVLACVLLSNVASAEPGELPDDELPGEEPLDLSTPLSATKPETGNLKAIDSAKPGVGWNAKVGIDYRKPPGAEFQPEQLGAGMAPDQSNGVAWANVTAPGLPLAWDKASIDTLIDPQQEQGKVATTLSRSLPLGEELSVTLQNGYSVSRTLANTPSTPTSQSWATSQGLRLNLLPTDTTLSVGADLSSSSDKWLRTLSAEQRLLGGPLSVTGSVSETASGDLSKSLKAGFKRTW